MDREKRLKTIKSHIAILSENEDEAIDLLQELLQDDWTKHIATAIKQAPSKWVDQPCIFCNELFKCNAGPTNGICHKCWLAHSYLASEVYSQRRRARERGLPATLTLRQWHKVVSDFSGKCAYCQKRDDRLKYGVLIEHFIPIDLGGGTTKENCVPSCYTCNGKKRQCHPLKVLHLFPNGEIQRVQEYLKSIS
jgi:5-methylcytosine-specific restriction endonuclease McrA